MSAKPKERLVTELVNEVFLAAAEFGRAGDEIAAPFGLSAARWLILGAVKHEPRTVAEIARVRGLTRQSARESTLRLERDRLVERVPNPGDARSPLVRLTGSGRAALRSIEPRRASWTAATSRHVTADQLKAALACLRAVTAER